MKRGPTAGWQHTLLCQRAVPIAPAAGGPPNPVCVAAAAGTAVCLQQTATEWQCKGARRTRAAGGRRLNDPTPHEDARILALEVSSHLPLLSRSAMSGLGAGLGGGRGVSDPRQASHAGCWDYRRCEARVSRSDAGWRLALDAHAAHGRPPRRRPPPPPPPRRPLPAPTSNRMPAGISTSAAPPPTWAHGSSRQGSTLCCLPSSGAMRCMVGAPLPWRVPSCRR